jgi:hypothetical protein
VLITADMLVQLVINMSSPSEPLVKATEIIAFCIANGIDIQGSGGSKNQALWDADRSEAAGQHRLQKFKRSATKRARNAWSLSTPLNAACAWADGHGWVIVPWSSVDQIWKWELAGTCAVTAPLI